MAEESPLHRRVSEVGLDNTSYWISELAKLGVKSLASLRHLEGDETAYTQLAEKAMYVVEKRALKELLKMPQPIKHENYNQLASEAKHLQPQRELKEVCEINKPMATLIPAKKSEKDVLLDELKVWSKEKKNSEQAIEEQLEYIVKLKKAIQNISPDMCAWVDILSNSEVQKYFNHLLQTTESPNIKLYIEEIIDQIDIPTVTEQVCSLIQSITSWLQDPFDVKSVSDLAGFNVFMKKILAHEKWIKTSKVSKLNTPQALSRYVSDALYHLRYKYKTTYEDIFIVSIVHPFVQDSVNDVVTLKPLLMSDLEFMQKIYSEQKDIFDVYSNKSTLLLQAYLFLLAFNVCHDSMGKGEMLFIKLTYQTMLDLPTKLCSSISDIMKKYFEESSLNVKKHLKYLIYPPCQGREKQLALIPTDKSNEQNYMVSQLRLLAYHEDDFSALQENQEAHVLFEQLELCEYYPQKVKLNDALCFKQKPLELSLREISVTNPNQLPFLIIHKLMSYDCHCRSNLLPIVQSPQYENENEESDEQSPLNTSGEVENGIHPLDCMLAILLCSDDFLTQDLLSRLAKCQLAIPLALYNPFKKQLCMPLWAMSSIIKEWKSIEDGNQTVSHVSPIIKHPMPVITFIRIGKHCRTSLSKSKILNDVISDDHHDYFFHRDCPGGNTRLYWGEV